MNVLWESFVGDVCLTHTPSVSVQDFPDASWDARCICVQSNSLYSVHCKRRFVLLLLFYLVTLCFLVCLWNLLAICEWILFRHHIFFQVLHRSLSCLSSVLCHGFSLAFSSILFSPPHLWLFFPSSISLSACSSIYECLCGGVREWWAFQTQRWAHFSQHTSQTISALSAPLDSEIPKNNKKEGILLACPQADFRNATVSDDICIYLINLHLMKLDAFIQSNFHCINALMRFWGSPMTS